MPLLPARDGPLLPGAPSGLFLRAPRRFFQRAPGGFFLRAARRLLPAATGRFFLFATRGFLRARRVTSASSRRAASASSCARRTVSSNCVAPPGFVLTSAVAPDRFASSWRGELLFQLAAGGALPVRGARLLPVRVGRPLPARGA